ncbi:hypothetical protein SNE40_011175 [Patella caerulea]
MYWSRDVMIETDFFNKTMPRDRALQILRYLHFADNERADPNDRLAKVRPVLDKLVANFKENYIPSQETSTDESLLKFKGRLKFRQNNRMKRARFGIKVYKVCQSTGNAAGYTCNLKIYTGQDRTNEDPASTAVVLELNHHLLNKGYNIFIDNWYSSPDLFIRLHQAKTNVCGTVRSNRKGMPVELRTVKLRKGEVEYRSCNEGLLALVWKDKTDVRMLSTMNNAQMIDTGKNDKHGKVIRKPQCVITYNLGMGGVDISDQMSATYHSVRKYVKWYKKLFFYIFDMAVLNSFFIYKELGGKIQLLDYKIKLVKEILVSCVLPTYSTRGRPHSLPSPARLSGRHFPEALPSTEKTINPCKRCTRCYSTGQRKETRYQCDICKTPLCVHPCFKDYHTKRNN